MTESSVKVTDVFERRPLRCHWPHLVPFAALSSRDCGGSFALFGTLRALILHGPFDRGRPNKQNMESHENRYQSASADCCHWCNAWTGCGAWQAKADLERDAKSSQATTVVAGSAFTNASFSAIHSRFRS